MPAEGKCSVAKIKPHTFFQEEMHFHFCFMFLLVPLKKKKKRTFKILIFKMQKLSYIA